MNPADYPLLESKEYDAPSVFQPKNLLREARRQYGLPDISVPAVCVLDPDGDIVRYAERSGLGRRHNGWACYHTDMWILDIAGWEIGIVGMAVGAPFAVLVAEQLAASGAKLTISLTSAGQIVEYGEPPYFVVIEQALRDEGTSAHYREPSKWSMLNDRLRSRLHGAFAGLDDTVLFGASWTTDAPYRETQAAISRAKTEDILCVEMEAAALYAYASAQQQNVICVAHITNTMAVDGDDFEKGADNGARSAIAVSRAIAAAATDTTSAS